MLYERQANEEVNMKGPRPRASRANLREFEKRRILENFVENDEALG